MDSTYHFKQPITINSVWMWGISVDVRSLSYEVLVKMYERHKTANKTNICNGYKEYVESKFYQREFESSVNLNLCCIQRSFWIYYLGLGPDHLKNDMTLGELKQNIQNELRQLGFNQEPYLINETWVKQY